MYILCAQQRCCGCSVLLSSSLPTISTAPTWTYEARTRQSDIASILRRFPRFHSDGYYYGLYTFFKKGYSSRLMQFVRASRPAEEILQWNSA